MAGAFLCGVRRPMKWRRFSGIGNEVFLHGPVAAHCMIALNPNVPSCRLIWSLICTVRAPSIILATNAIDDVAVGHGVASCCWPPAFPAIDSSQLSSLTRLLIANIIGPGTMVGDRRPRLVTRTLATGGAHDRNALTKTLHGIHLPSPVHSTSPKRRMLCLSNW